MDLNQILSKEKIEKKSDLVKLIKQNKEILKTLWTLDDRLNSIKESTRENFENELSFLIQEEFLKPENFKKYSVLINYISKRAEKRFINTKSFKEECNLLIDFLMPKRKDEEDRIKFIHYCTRGDKELGIIVRYDKTVNVLTEDMKILLKDNYESFLEFDREIQKKLKFNYDQKKFLFEKEKFSLIRMALTYLTSKRNGKIDYFFTDEIFKKQKRFKKITKEMRELNKIQKKYNAQIHFLMDSYILLYQDIIKYDDKK
jgi:predicted transglutaminase-like cysteine proteinase